MDKPSCSFVTLSSRSMLQAAIQPPVFIGMSQPRFERLGSGPVYRAIFDRSLLLSYFWVALNQPEASRPAQSAVRALSRTRTAKLSGTCAIKGECQ